MDIVHGALDIVGDLDLPKLRCRDSTKRFRICAYRPQAHWHAGPISMRQHCCDLILVRQACEALKKGKTTKYQQKKASTKGLNEPRRRHFVGHLFRGEEEALHLAEE